MRILLDTHVLLWAAKGSLPSQVQSLLDDSTNELYFSSVNLWEIEIKRSKLKLDPKVLYQNLLHNGYRELAVSSRHVLSLPLLPNLHKDPFDRILLAQALSEQVFLLTADDSLKKYSAHLDCVLNF
jgi:PIN domain nuclease of toxin-antitoxin system